VLSRDASSPEGTSRCVSRGSPRASRRRVAFVRPASRAGFWVVLGQAQRFEPDRDGRTDDNSSIEQDVVASRASALAPCPLGLQSALQGQLACLAVRLFSVEGCFLSPRATPPLARACRVPDGRLCDPWVEGARSSQVGAAWPTARLDTSRRPTPSCNGPVGRGAEGGEQPTSVFCVGVGAFVRGLPERSMHLQPRAVAGSRSTSARFLSP
jgi:hypothetical protein